MVYWGEDALHLSTQNMVAALHYSMLGDCIAYFVAAQKLCTVRRLGRIGLQGLGFAMWSY